MAKKKRNTNNKPPKSRRKSAQAPGNTVAPVLPTGLQLGLLVLCCVLAYSMTLNVPFYLDDFSSIRENLAIRDLGNLDAVVGFSPLRAVSYISFAINFAIHEYSLAGYHLTNLGIHLAASLVVFWLARGLLQQSESLTVAARGQAEEQTHALLRGYFPLLVALLFALHPLQTQAVTYIVQRSASLAGLFYLAAMLCYLRARLAEQGSTRIILFTLTALLGVLAIFTKQNAVTLPAALVLMELVFFRLRGRVLLKGLLMLGGAALVGALLLLLVGGTTFFSSLSEATRETDLVSRGEYLAIQMSVLWIYISKYFFPWPLHLEYDIGVMTFANPAVVFFALLHLGAIGFALWNLRRRPLLAFAILFYYLAHSVESSIIPIRDFAFEHRTYLPNFGMSLLVAWVFLYVLPRFMERQQIISVAVLILAVLLGLTVNRNFTWRDPIAFYQHETEVNPQVLRSWSILGETYLREFRNEEAVEAYRQGERLYNRSFDRDNNTQVAFYQNYILALDRVGAFEEALEVLERINLDVLDRRNLSRFLFLRGNIYARQERFELARADFSRAQELNGMNIDARLGLAKVLYLQGQLRPAREALVRLIELDPQHYSIEESRTLLDHINQTLAPGR